MINFSNTSILLWNRWCSWFAERRASEVYTHDKLNFSNTSILLRNRWCSWSAERRASEVYTHDKLNFSNTSILLWNRWCSWSAERRASEVYTHDKQDETLYTSKNISLLKWTSPSIVWVAFYEKTSASVCTGTVWLIYKTQHSRKKCYERWKKLLKWFQNAHWWRQAMLSTGFCVHSHSEENMKMVARTRLRWHGSERRASSTSNLNTLD